MAFVCADMSLRLFTNPLTSVRDGPRNPLCAWEVDPASFELSNPQLILDATAAKLPFFSPLIDMCKLCPNQGRRQLLLFRVITRRQTAHQDLEHPLTPQEHALAGIHHSEIIYGDDVPEPWEFAPVTPEVVLRTRKVNDRTTVVSISSSPSGTAARHGHPELHTSAHAAARRPQS
jgi:hypothetical protein